MRALLPAILPCLAWGYALKQTGDGFPLRWPDGSVRCAIDEHDSEDLSGRSGLGAVHSAMATWNAIPGSPVRLEVDASAKPPAARVTWWPDWEDLADALALTVVTYEVETGDIVDAEIRINDEVEWTIADWGPGEGQRFDVQNTLAHEMGHLLGLAHSDADEQATMYPTSAPWEVVKRDLATDDLAGFSHLYGLGEPDDVSTPAARAAGCQMTPWPAGGPDTATLLAVAALLLRRRWIRVVVIGTTLLTSSAQATVVRGTSLSELAARADRIVLARVLRSEALWVLGTIHTDTVVEVVDCLAGPCAKLLVVRQPGGEVGPIGQSVEGSVTLPAGEEFLLFLRQVPGTARTRPVAMGHGIFLIRGGRARGALEAQSAQRGPPRFEIRDLRRLLAASPLGQTAISPPVDVRQNGKSL